jgi:hypothetical protein
MKLVSLAAIAAMTLAPLAAQAQTTTLAQDNASSAAYGGAGYTTGSNGGFGFGAFNIVATGSAGTFEYTSKESENGSGDIDSPAFTAGGSPLSFGLYAQTTGSAITISRSFTAPVAIPGEVFSLDFVKGYNDAGTSGVALTTAAGTTGDFTFTSGGVGIDFNKTATPLGFSLGADHLVYTFTSATAYSLSVTGADTFTGTGTTATPITGFQIAQTDSGAATPDHNAYFNNLSLTVPAAAPVPEASSLVGFGLLLALGGMAVAARKRTVKA